MEKFLGVVFAILLIALGVQPANAAEVAVTVKFTGSTESFLGAKVSLMGQNETFVQPITAEGNVAFSVPAGTYSFTLSANSAPALLGLSVLQRQITAPAALELKVPTARYTKVRYVLPDGSLLPNFGLSGSGANAQLNTGDGFTWNSQLGQQLSVKDGVTSYRVYVAPDARGPIADSTYDQDGDGFGDLRISQVTANGGYRTLLIPSSVLIKGGDYAVSDASYLQFDQSELIGAARSTFTVTGRIVNVGKGVSGTMLRQYFLTSQSATPNNYNGIYSGPGSQFTGQKAPNSDGTFSLNVVLSATSTYFTAMQANALYSFPSAILPIKTTVAKSTYRNCAALNLDFQGGVSTDYSKNKGAAIKFKPTLNLKLYATIKKLDVDKDGIACEK